LNDDELESNGNEKKKYDDEENLSLKYFESKKKIIKLYFFVKLMIIHIWTFLGNNMTTVAYVAPTRKILLRETKLTKFS